MMLLLLVSSGLMGLGWLFLHLEFMRLIKLVLVELLEAGGDGEGELGWDCS